MDLGSSLATSGQGRTGMSRWWRVDQRSSATADQDDREPVEGDVDEPAGARTPRWVTVALVGACALAVASASVVRSPKQDDRFCNAALALGSANGQVYPLQDQGAPGPDHCDRQQPAAEGDGWVSDGYLGYDCRVHFAVGVVSEPVMAPNRADGTCGQAEP
jgi:hypothetical protein